MIDSVKARNRSKPIIVWLGDDFTGAAATMEALSFSGVSSLLFLDLPTQEQLAACEGVEAFGIATLARTHSPEWMDENLPALFAFLDATEAELVHYKICSTLDSSPQTGSIGKAIELATQQFGEATVPVVTAVPRMHRYQAFGNLFCGAGNIIDRLDRHPVMSRHPITPMREADVARHLAAQTDIPTRCLNAKVLADHERSNSFLDEWSGANICTFDCLDSAHEKAIGKLLWERRKESRFVVGSQGIEYALVAHLLEVGEIQETPPSASLGFDARFAVVSGSVSPITADQIAWARNNGFKAIRVNASDLCGDEQKRLATEQTALEAAHRSLSEGLCPLLFTAEGPDDPAVTKFNATVSDQTAANVAIGQSLGRILKLLVEATGLRRVCVSGGDTSGHVCSELGIFALEAAAPTIPAAAICRARSENAFGGLEIALKGGQMGSQDYFGWVRDGGGERS